MGAGLPVDSVYVRFDGSWMNAEMLGNGFCRMPFHQLHENLVLASRQGGQKTIAHLCRGHARLVQNAQAYSVSVYFQERPDLRGDTYILMARLFYLQCNSSQEISNFPRFTTDHDIIISN